MKTEKFSLLRKILKALGLSRERIDEIISWIQTWLQVDEEKKTGEVKYPYHIRDDFLSPAEQSFYHVLVKAAGEWAAVAPKVSLGDLFYAKTGEFSKNRIYLNKIDRKHLDFLLIDPGTLKPILGIELDDKSHQRKDRKKRDQFVDGVFAAAGLPLAHVDVRHSYQVEGLSQYLKETAGQVDATIIQGSRESDLEKSQPNCPKCGFQMVLRTAKSGTYKGNQFWGCTNYPRCKGIRTQEL